MGSKGDIVINVSASTFKAVVTIFRFDTFVSINNVSMCFISSIQYIYIIFWSNSNPIVSFFDQLQLFVRRHRKN